MKGTPNPSSSTQDNSPSEWACGERHNWFPSSVLVCPPLSQNELHTLLTMIFCFRKAISY